jgi:CheY-like chemotaxis protein
VNTNARRRPLLVALTGWGQDEDRRRSEEAGFDAHLVKPVDDVVLCRLLAELGAGRQEAINAESLPQHPRRSAERRP